MSTTAPIHLGPAKLMLDPSGAVWWPERSTVIVSDLHLEKGSACARRGALVPPLDTRVTLDRLAVVLRHLRPARVIALGDSFHDDDGFARMQTADRARLSGMTRETAFTWVLGNHDPTPRGADGIGGEWTEVAEIGGLMFRHEARQGVAGTGSGEVCGHHHPKASVEARGGAIVRPCFVADPRRLMLPAFGAYTGGLDVRHPAIAGLFPRGGRAFLLGRDRLFSFALNG